MSSSLPPHLLCCRVIPHKKARRVLRTNQTVLAFSCTTSIRFAGKVKEYISKEQVKSRKIIKKYFRQAKYLLSWIVLFILYSSYHHTNMKFVYSSLPMPAVELAHFLFILSYYRFIRALSF